MYLKCTLFYLEKANIVVFPEPLCDDLTSLTLDSDKSYQLECTATGNPLPIVRWSINAMFGEQILIQKVLTRLNIKLSYVVFSLLHRIITQQLVLSIYQVHLG